MRIVTFYSHLNGLEFLKVHQRALWTEIRNVIMASTPKPAVPKSKLPDLTQSIRINQTDFVKNRVAVEVQFGKYSFVAYDLFVKHLAFYVGDVIDVGVEILPMKELQAEMSSGVAYYEGELYNLIREGRGVPAVPLILIGVAP